MMSITQSLKYLMEEFVLLSQLLTVAEEAAERRAHVASAAGSSMGDRMERVSRERPGQQLDKRCMISVGIEKKHMH